MSADKDEEQTATPGGASADEHVIPEGFGAAEEPPTGAAAPASAPFAASAPAPAPAPAPSPAPASAPAPAGPAAGAPPLLEEDGVRRFVWYAWPWVNWLLPVFVCFHGFLGNNGGWESLMLMFASPILVPAAGLLGSLPRFIMRKRGFRHAPWALLPVLFGLWWSWLTVALAMEGVGDSGSLPSLLAEMSSARFPDGFESILMATAAFLGCLLWVAVLGIASGIQPGAGESKRAEVLAWVVAIALPVILAVATMTAAAIGPSN